MRNRHVTLIELGNSMEVVVTHNRFLYVLHARNGVCGIFQSTSLPDHRYNKTTRATCSETNLMPCAITCAQLA